MDGENHGNPIKMDDLGGFPIFLVQHPYTSMRQKTTVQKVIEAF